MAFEKINNTTAFIKPKLLKAGDKITGYYVGTWSSPKFPDLKSIRIKLIEDFNGKTSTTVNDKEVETPLNLKAGDEVLVNASGNLKYFIVDQEQGYLYQFIYKGKRKITKGPAMGKETHHFEILKDSTQKLTDDLPF
jgi:hypothetical protein